MGKTVAIFVLAVTAMLLAGVTVQSLMEKQVQAQSGRFADYAMISAAMTEDADALCIVDTVTQRMLFWTYDNAGRTFQLMPKSKADLRRQFGEPR
jgi:hypothetical protein